LPEDVVKDSQVRDKPIRGDRGDRRDRDKVEPKIACEVEGGVHRMVHVQLWQARLLLR
jgi:hypothetical protein